MAMAGCNLDRATFKMGDGQAAFNVEVVDTFESRAKGLMFRESMARFSGMLFVYDAPQRVSFWMRNTLIPLDMIFMDQTGLVTRVHDNAVPLDETSIFGGDQVFAVFEVNGGMAQKLGIQAGAMMQHPAFNQEIAAWPCKN
jgi:uncharacterized membrane protein (UPF0127 family)